MILLWLLFVCVLVLVSAYYVYKNYKRAYDYHKALKEPTLPQMIPIFKAGRSSRIVWGTTSIWLVYISIKEIIRTITEYSDLFSIILFTI